MDILFTKLETKLDSSLESKLVIQISIQVFSSIWTVTSFLLFEKTEIKTGHAYKKAKTAKRFKGYYV